MLLRQVPVRTLVCQRARQWHVRLSSLSYLTERS